MYLLLAACVGTIPTDPSGPAGTDSGGVTAPEGCPTSGDGDFDPVGQCAAGICNPVYYPEVEQALGEPAACTSHGTTSNCFWPVLGINLTFTDCDEDGAPDPDEALCAMTLQELRISAPCTGTSAGGLGLNQDRTCWERVFGPGEGTEVVMWYSVGGDPSRTLEVDFYPDIAGAVSMYWSG